MSIVTYVALRRGKADFLEDGTARVCGDLIIFAMTKDLLRAKLYEICTSLCCPSCQDNVPCCRWAFYARAFMVHCMIAAGITQEGGEQRAEGSFANWRDGR